MLYCHCQTCYSMIMLYVVIDRGYPWAYKRLAAGISLLFSELLYDLVVCHVIQGQTGICKLFKSISPCNN